VYSTKIKKIIVKNVIFNTFTQKYGLSTKITKKIIFKNSEYILKRKRKLIIKLLA
jgi:hypothetical protein